MIKGITKEMIDSVLTELNAIFKEIVGIDNVLACDEETDGIMLATPMLLSKSQVEEFVMSQKCIHLNEFIKKSGLKHEEVIKDIIFLTMATLNNDIMTMMQNFPGERFMQYVDSLDRLAEMEAAEDKKQKLKGLLGSKGSDN